ncbi:hypothetical protein [Halostagnicola kamekurae]|uniref:Uncharacterized protein n=1 Tax=Halostagnicola kamekurae TaxID=619731 RepID=A0A1I6RE06_9EURY|nr:hypothetical protein [Halostagnicola kamekurae]SFS62943.1 hypothetical protein SAMN04488556_1730 [Halostagnicola kamekurae]
MVAEPGQNGGDSTSTIGYSDASDTTEAGDAVGITGGEIEPGTDTEQLLGVRARGRATENSGIAPVHVGGVTVASVEGTVSGGDDLDLGTTGGDGVLETSAGGPAHALSDAGGSWRGQDAPDGYAWVLL